MFFLPFSQRKVLFLSYSDTYLYSQSNPTPPSTLSLKPWPPLRQIFCTLSFILGQSLRRLPRGFQSKYRLAMSLVDLLGVWPTQIQFHHHTFCTIINKQVFQTLVYYAYTSACSEFKIENQNNKIDCSTFDFFEYTQQHCGWFVSHATCHYQFNMVAQYRATNPTERSKILQQGKRHFLLHSKIPQFLLSPDIADDFKI